jgi:hypothetical protein
MARVKEDLRPLGGSRSWANSPGTYISGQAHIDGADALAIAMERKWGADRLRLLVSPELREKFDRQRYRLNAAIWHGDLEAVRVESERMARAWRALDGAAEAAGVPELPPEVWELALADGTVVAIVKDDDGARRVLVEGRRLVVYTLEEIGRMLENYQAVTKVKEAFPGSSVTQVRTSIEDPLDALRDGVTLDDRLDDINPAYGA